MLCWEIHPFTKLYQVIFNCIIGTGTSEGALDNKSWHPASYVTLELLFAASLIRWQPGDPAAEIRQRETGIFIFLAIPGARADNMRRVTDTRDCCHPPLPILLETGIKLHPLPPLSQIFATIPGFTEQQRLPASSAPVATRLIVTTEKTGPIFVVLFSFNGHYTLGVLRSASHLNCSQQLTLLWGAEQIFLFFSNDFSSFEILIVNKNIILDRSRWNEECPDRQLDSCSLSERLILLLTLKIFFKQIFCI